LFRESRPRKLAPLIAEFPERGVNIQNGLLSGSVFFIIYLKTTLHLFNASIYNIYLQKEITTLIGDKKNERKEFKMLDKVADTICDKFDDLHMAGVFSEIFEQLQTVAGRLPGTFYVNFNVELIVFDTKRERSRSLLSTGFTTGEEKPYRASKDSSTQRYVVEGDICTVPEDYFPHCWAEWSFKIKNPTCPTCGYKLDKQVKLLIDDDICPWCEEGTVSINNPVCTDCGYRIERDTIIWG